MKDAFAVETSAPTSSPVGPSDAASVGKGSMAITDSRVCIGTDTAAKIHEREIGRHRKKITGERSRLCVIGHRDRLWIPSQVKDIV